MLISITTKRLYQIGAVLVIPVAIYNFLVWLENSDSKWESQYIKSFIGGIGCIILSLYLLYFSFTKPNKTIIIYNNELNI